MNRSRLPFILLTITFLTLAPGFPVLAAPKKGAPPDAFVMPKTADPSKGKILFRHYCAVCHGISGKGDGPNFEHLDPHPADLTDAEYMDTATEETIYKVIEGGGGALEISIAMPPWGRTLTREQIWDLVAYVRSLTRPQPVEKRPATNIKRLVPVGEKECRLCHVKQGEIRQIAPDLGQEGSKLNKNWLYAFLKKPTKIRPVGYMPITKSVMPNFQFTDDEALSLTEYLMTKKNPRVSKTALTEVLMSRSEVEKGKELFVNVFSCDGCHMTGGKKGGIVGPDLAEAGRRLRPDWIVSWMKNPQALRPDSPMPNFGMKDEQIKAVLAYILSLQGPPVSPLPSIEKPAIDLIKKGETLVKDKNCLGCHILKTDHEKDQRPEAAVGRLAALDGEPY